MVATAGKFLVPKMAENRCPKIILPSKSNLGNCLPSQPGQAKIPLNAGPLLVQIPPPKDQKALSTPFQISACKIGVPWQTALKVAIPGPEISG